MGEAWGRLAVGGRILDPPDRSGGGMGGKFDAPAFSAIRRGGVRMADRLGLCEPRRPEPTEHEPATEAHRVSQ